MKILTIPGKLRETVQLRSKFAEMSRKANLGHIQVTVQFNDYNDDDYD